ncbi:hypothetical protein K431DRAFT_295831 [Polychaeton citri CBS 116435]|uniref:Amidase domain-containing protein n=1 Tax=Polychaeton citri CBS 116435 TaxID=1314669 RepID=A0A9P4Q337_9PEZI|nr:hypothetical protein K431DRAFT_295831 [Polychaeton citri CBS 116435]
MPPPHIDQKDLIAANDDYIKEDGQREAITKGLLLAGKNGVDEAMSKHEIDLILGPADSVLYCLTAAAGYPIGTVPLSAVKFNDTDSRPEGLRVLGKANDDEMILELMQRFETLFPGRMLPEIDT